MVRIIEMSSLFKHIYSYKPTFMSEKQQKAGLLKENLRYLVILLTIWFLVSYGAESYLKMH